MLTSANYIITPREIIVLPLPISQPLKLL